MYKLLGSQAAANTTPSQFANNRVVRLTTGATAGLMTLWDNPIPLNLTINASANATTLLTLTDGNTAGVGVNMRIIGSSNTGVVNTAVPSQVASIVNTTAITSNVDIIIANGVAQIWVTGTKTFTITPNSEFVIEKGRTEFISSNNDTTIFGLPVSYRG